MEWTQITVKIAARDAQTACDIAQMAVPYGFYLEDYSDLIEGAAEIAHSSLIDEELLAKDRETACLHLYISSEEHPGEALNYLTSRLTAAGIPFETDTKQVQDDDWADGWKKYFKPVEIGEKLLICPSWEQCDNPAGRLILRIDPGAAFGTGTHSTTKLCLEALERHITPGCRMLDVGTGSGILSIGALLLGAQSAVGVDIDAQSVKTARENGAENGFFPPRMEVHQGNLTRGVSGTFDVIAANIVADAIILLSKDIPPLLKPDGVFLTSGILTQYQDEVMDALRQAGFTDFAVFEDGGWVCIEARMKEQHN